MEVSENQQVIVERQNTESNKVKKGFNLQKLRYKNMNIRGRLMTAFASILLFVIVIGGVSFLAVTDIYNEVDELNQVELAYMKNLDNVNYLSGRKLAAMRGYLITESETYLDNIEANTQTQYEEIERVLYHSNSEEVEAVMNEIMELDVYMQNEIINFVENGDLDGAMENTRNIYNPRIEQNMDDVLELSLVQSTQARDSIYSVLDHIDTTRLVVGVLMIVATIAAIAAALLSAKSFREPIINVMLKLQDFGAGNLAVEPFNIDGETEMDQLLQATDQVQRDLTRIISNIRLSTEELAQQSEELTQSASEVRSGSEQVAMTMQELSTGTESQAHAASDLASNMEAFSIEFENASKSSEEIVAASEGVVTLSGQGVKLMNSSSEQMTKINHIVQDAVGKMNELEKDTQEINKLVEIIHGIANQTNLLALNAAIEAARAGEHGRGFSIVADEVRKLSEQVAESVEEITGFVVRIQADSKGVTQSLISGETEATAGIKSINETSATFDQIFDSIDKVVNNINDVNGTLMNLSKTNDEMSGSVAEVASVSEESAAGVEETSAASQEINSTMDEVASSLAYNAELAENLNVLVARFQLSDQTN